MAWLGMLVGSTVVVLLFALFLEWAIFKRITNSPDVGMPLSVAAAVVLAIVIYGFGNANGGAWRPFPGGLSYVFGGAIVYGYRRFQYRRRLEQDELGDTFR